MNNENKPNWNNAPEWANWLAQEKSGAWRWFEKKPNAFMSGWIENTGKEKNCMEIIEWKQTLQERTSENYPSVRQIWREKGTNNNVEIIFVSKITVGFVDSDGIEHFVPKESYFLKMFLVV